MVAVEVHHSLPRVESTYLSYYDKVLQGPRHGRKTPDSTMELGLSDATSSHLCTVLHSCSLQLIDSIHVMSCYSIL